MQPDTRLLLITLFEGMAESLRQGTFRFTEEQAQTLVRILAGLPPQDSRPAHGPRICTIAQACRYLGISQPTFRKRIREGLIPQGTKLAGFNERVWNKEDIETYAATLKKK